MADEEVWVQLYIVKDKSGRVLGIDIASLDGKKRIQELATAVYQAKGKSLSHCDAADLVVYKAGTECPSEGEDKLRPSWIVPTDTTDELPLRVVAPAREVNQQQNLKTSFLGDGVLEKLRLAVIYFVDSKRKPIGTGLLVPGLLYEYCSCYSNRLLQV
jgi:hypothetical protein